MNDYFVRLYPEPNTDTPLVGGNPAIEPEPSLQAQPAKPIGRRTRCFMAASIPAIIAAAAWHILAGPPEWPPVPQFVVLGALLTVLYYLVIFAICDRRS